ncbi:NAD(P)/FAD-dependent oxidoreductase [Gracilibacillus caseinilyticus]|uniref:Ferredoxin--NADP reductase n=1 Tax=Gracilibacillus caseinilyticus TaxID=2932256 RepID=A0ABY4ESU7_9BACI|nr:NAD(P)/FAD-dependent oxidoreductase [Gracilibacillus caseinilyticus]UOQ47500.1 NAD(P)/FAD-dependent oxidoreductase [Gracilibacillus caseinilyticus]
MKDIYDVTIIGGGPAGLFASFYSGLRDLKTKIIEYQPYLGGKVHVYPEKMIWDVGGQPPISGGDFIKQIVQQAHTFSPTVALDTKVTDIRKEEDYFILSTNKETHYSKTVIVAIGGGILNPQKLKLDGIDKFEVTNLHYIVPSLQQFKHKRVLISGGGNAAVDWANELEPIAEKVILVYRSEQLKGHEAEVNKVLSSSIEIHLDTTIEKLVSEQDNDHISKALLYNKKHQTEQWHEIDEVIINHGYVIDRSLFENSSINIALDEYQLIQGNTDSSTNIPGIYAAGDILKHESKLHLIAGCFQDACNAVNKAKQFIDPSSHESAMVSSHNEKFKTKNKELLKTQKILD